MLSCLPSILLPSRDVIVSDVVSVLRNFVYGINIVTLLLTGALPNLQGFTEIIAVLSTLLLNTYLGKYVYTALQRFS